MFSAEKAKIIYAPRLTGEVNADFYDERYYLGEGKSIWDKPYEWENFRHIFKGLAAFIISGFPETKSFLNVGCARGFLERAFVELLEKNPLLDMSIKGFDISSWAIANAEAEAKPFVSVASVDNYQFTKNYDVMIALDTFEHLTKEQVTRFLLRSRKFINDCGFFVIALDEERQRNEPSHVNLQDRVWWENKFIECGWTNDWSVQMMETLAQKEKFIKQCKIEIFIRRAQAENGSLIKTPYDGKLLEMARLDRWETPKENKNEN